MDKSGANYAGLMTIACTSILNNETQQKISHNSPKT
jgi:hypothetical protein